MKKLLISLMVVSMMMFAAAAFAAEGNCVDSAKFIGNWQAHFTRGVFADDAAVTTTMTAVDKGEQKLEDVLAADGVTVEGVGDVEVLESGEGNFAMSMPLPEQPLTMDMNVKSAWKIECDKLITTLESVEEVKIVINEDAKLDDAKKAEIEKMIPEMEKQVKESMDKDPKAKDPDTETILYSSDKYVVTKGKADEKGVPAYVIYVKQ